MAAAAGAAPTSNGSFAAALAAVREAADGLGAAPGLLATTLSVAVIAGARVAIGQVGDGIAVHGAGDAVDAVAVGERSEYVNETVFLTTPGALSDHLRTFCTSADAVDALALTTDGLRYQVLDDVAAGTPFAPFFQAAWAYARRADATPDAVAAFLDEISEPTRAATTRRSCSPSATRPGRRPRRRA